MRSVRAPRARAAAFRLVMGLALVMSLACTADSGSEVVFEGDDGPVVFRVERAETAEEQGRGLMGRESLAPDRGMLFVWREVAHRSFFMKDTLIPLDLIVIRGARVVEVHRLEPCREEPCPETLTARADAEVEVNAGAAARAGIHAGTRVVFR